MEQKIEKIEMRPYALEIVSDASVTWRYIAPAGHTLEQCTQPGYWRHGVRELGQQRVMGRPSFNRIEILAEDGTWEAELRVVSVRGEQVTTRLLREWRAPAKADSDLVVPEGYVVEHVKNNGWRALDPNKQVVVDKQPVKREALLAAIEHAKRAAV